MRRWQPLFRKLRQRKLGTSQRSRLEPAIKGAIIGIFGTLSVTVVNTYFADRRDQRNSIVAERHEREARFRDEKRAAYLSFYRTGRKMALQIDNIIAEGKGLTWLDDSADENVTKSYVDLRDEYLDIALVGGNAADDAGRQAMTSSMLAMAEGAMIFRATHKLKIKAGAHEVIISIAEKNNSRFGADLAKFRAAARADLLGEERPPALGLQPKKRAQD